MSEELELRMYNDNKEVCGYRIPLFEIEQSHNPKELLFSIYERMLKMKKASETPTQ